MLEKKILEAVDHLHKLINKNKPLLTLKDVVQYTQLSPSTIHRAISSGELNPFRKKGKLLFKKSSIERWLNG